MVIITGEPINQKTAGTMALAGLSGKDMITHLRELK